jgi:hypothetical protein
MNLLSMVYESILFTTIQKRRLIEVARVLIVILAKNVHTTIFAL